MRYLVRAGSAIRASAEVDRAGIRVGAVEGTSASRNVAKALKSASSSLFFTPDPAVELLGQGRLATRAWAARFLEEAKADGTVRRALDNGGSVNATVAPAR